MQTFVPESTITEIAACLDWRRLNKQITEATQIITACAGHGGWANHPAVRMWRGHEHALARYGLGLIAEWRRRGYDSHHGTEAKFHAALRTFPDNGFPSWWGRSDIIHSHRSRLIEKMPDHYQQFWPDVSPGTDYVWPV